MLPMLGMALGSRCPFAPRAGVLFMLRRGGDSGTHDDPARHEWLGGSTTTHRRRGTAPHTQAACLEMVSDHGVHLAHRHPVTQPQPDTEVCTALA